MDQDKLMEFLGKFVGDLGATMAAGNVLLGERLGLYRALAGKAQTPQELADATGTDARYVDEWLRGQAAGGYVQHQDGVYSMTEEQAFALTDPDGPVFVPGAFQLALGSLQALPRITEAVRTGGGLGWHEHDAEVFEGCERFFRPGYLANLTASWLPALDGVEDKLRGGARVADIGCGHGASSVILAQTYPGFDSHGASIETARQRAHEAGVAQQRSLRWPPPRAIPPKQPAPFAAQRAGWTRWASRFKLCNSLGLQKLSSAEAAQTPACRGARVARAGGAGARLR